MGRSCLPHLVLAAVLISIGPLRSCFLGAASHRPGSRDSKLRLLRLGSEAEDNQAPADVSRRQPAQLLGAGLAAFFGVPGAFAKITDADKDEIFKSTVRPRSVATEILQMMDVDPVPNDTGDPKKHMPTVEMGTSGRVVVTLKHGMDPVKEIDGEVIKEAHYIQYIWLADAETGRILAGKNFEATDKSPPTMSALLPKGVTAYPMAYCNLHGLWKGEKFTA
mmetsp:Transcript_63986/g.115148  ORF Transcript_63986/g.115148 Transcript_63986/m.115148 type:complete len:221 (+) Transcript_63986:88-750(+)